MRVLGTRILRRARRRSGMSQEDLAENSGISVRTIREIESGRISAPRPATGRFLADASSDPDRPALPNPPAQLPAASAGFAGRVRQLECLTETLRSGVSSNALVIATVSGPAGVGKTALAVEWAHRSAGLLPDGQLYVDLRGFAPSGAAVGPLDVIRNFLGALGADPARVPADPAGGRRRHGRGDEPEPTDRTGRG